MSCKMGVDNSDAGGVSGRGGDAVRTYHVECDRITLQGDPWRQSQLP